MRHRKNLTPLFIIPPLALIISPGVWAGKMGVVFLFCSIFPP